VATLRVIEDERLCENSARLGAWLLGRLEDLATRHPAMGEVRGRGLMVGVELVEDRKTMTPAAQLATRVRTACRERGLIVGVGGFFGNVVRIQPPLVISQEQLGSALGTLDAVLTEAAAQTPAR
jgi:4-aminobutyrate aminotransferase-like enzyme